MRKSTEAQIKASAKYDAKNTKLIPIKLNLKTDADILEWMDQQSNRQGAIKELIRKAIKGESLVPVIEKKIVEGDFIEGEFVTVMIDGKEFRRKVYFSKKWNDLVIIIYGNEYAYSEFK